jgi:hypothetical protein
VMEPSFPRRRPCRPSPWRRPGATLDAGRWCGPACSDLVGTGVRLPGHQPISTCRRRRTHRGYLTRITDDYVDNRCGPGPDAPGLRVTERT